MAVLQEVDRRPKLVFENGDKENGKLLMVIIESEVWEDQQFRMYFCQKGRNETCLDYFDPIGKYISLDDPGWIPKRFFDPAINQARAIFAKYGLPDRGNYRKRKKTKVPKGQQARLFR